MPEILRRVLFWAAITVLILAGMISQSRPGLGVTVLNTVTMPSETALQDPRAKARAQQAIFATFKCATLLLSYQLKAAEQACGESIALLPNSPVGYKFRGFAYLLEHRYERAEPDFRDAVRLDPGDSDNQAGYAQSLSGQGRFDEAVARFGVALSLAPHDVRYLSARCWARAGEGKDLDQALIDCNLALKLRPKSAVAYDSRALVRLKQGRNPLAIADYSRSLSLQPGRATALFGRAIAELKLGKPADARTDLFRARQADPEIDDIYIMVGVLEPGCRDGQGPCVLPKDLRSKQPSGSPYYMTVSYSVAPTPRPSPSDEEIVQSIELGRSDAILEQVAILLNVPASVAPLWQDDQPVRLSRHLIGTRKEYERLREEACRRGLVYGQQCTALPAQPAATLGLGIETLVTRVQPLWESLCLPHADFRDPGICQME